MKWLLILFDIGLTVAMYGVSRALAKRYASPFTTPVFFSTTLVILVLRALGLRFEDYEPAKNIMVWLLSPATVGLAVPLYKNRHTLVRHALPAFVGLVVGSLSTLLAAAILAKVFALSENLRASVSSESVTSPAAVERAALIHGNRTSPAALRIA